MLRDFEDLFGCVLTNVYDSKDESELVFELDNGESYKLYHEQDCCESVWIEDIVGDLKDLIGSPILLAKETYDDDVNHPYTEWTYYKLATINGYVDIRWCGESEYYSIAVSFSRC